MADTTSSTDYFSVFNQTFVLLGSDGITQYPLTVDMVDMTYHSAIATQANYGSQIGATVMMLLVCLIMTPKSKFARIPTLINIAALAFNLIRVVMLVWYPASTWYEFYIIMTGDITTVSRSNYNTSTAATFFTVPVTILMLCALAVQAWTMVQLWPKAVKVAAMGVSALVVITAVGFKITDSVYQALWILNEVEAPRWVRQVDLACSAASICYFCFLFNIRLLIHMWSNHSILPSVKGLSAMEVLVMTNGILMFIPSTSFRCCTANRVSPSLLTMSNSNLLRPGIPILH
jgi:pheromone alpha factor receptor